MKPNRVGGREQGGRGSGGEGITSELVRQVLCGDGGAALPPLRPGVGAQVSRGGAQVLYHSETVRARLFLCFPLSFGASVTCLNFCPLVAPSNPRKALMGVIHGYGSVSVRAGLGSLEAEATGRIGAVHAAQGDHTQVQLRSVSRDRTKAHSSVYAWKSNFHARAISLFN
jgi:hypothetical protein